MSLYCIHSVREGDLLEKLISELIEKLYDIGTVSEVTEILGGFTNRGFGIRTQKDSNSSVYFVRRYKDVVTRKEIQFEHALNKPCNWEWNDHPCRSKAQRAYFLSQEIPPELSETQSSVRPLVCPPSNCDSEPWLMADGYRGTF